MTAVEPPQPATIRSQLPREAAPAARRAAWQRWLSLAIYNVPLIRRTLEGVLHRQEWALLSFYKDPATVAELRRAYRQAPPLVKPLEAHFLSSLARTQARLDGALAELGVCQGGTAKLLCAAKGDRAFWGFDTFAGLPPAEAVDRIWGVRFFHEQQYRADEAVARRTLAEFAGVRLVRGEFPASSELASDERFSLVHLDADLYRSTRSGLEFFWPRLVPGGVIVVHDSHAAGVSQAIREFVAETGAIEQPSLGSYHLVLDGSR